ncbi:MAG TPA: type II secretion system F family protein [Acidimicrobiia bacterium]|jgi:Flp pilus assembly protein TadB
MGVGASPALPAALCVAVGTGALVHALVPHRARAAARVRPYTGAARASLGHAPDVGAATFVARGDARGVAAVLLGPLRALAQRLGAIVESRTDEAIELRLFQAGRRDVSVTEHRVAQVARGARVALVLGAAGVLFVPRPLVVLALVVAGFVAGAARVRGDLDRAIARRTERMELELATVNQLLAMHVRSGSGAVQSVQRLVDRGQGVLVEELDATLARIRSGMREPEAFRRAAELTPCRDAARTYLLIATSVERGSDLAVALLAIGDDLRDARREALRKSAVRRRAGMLAPTIGILAPIMLLFVAAPLPSIVLGNR